MTKADNFDSNNWTQVSLSDYVDLTSNQTITGLKTVNEIDFKVSADTSKIAKLTNIANYYFAVKMNNDNALLFDFAANSVNATNLYPLSNNARSLGSSSLKWRDIYLAGGLKDGNNANYGLVLPNTTGYTANQTIATEESITGYPIYDNTTTYAVGDKVLYGGVGYRCKTAITSAEAFDSSKWETIQLINYVDINTNQVIKGTKTVKSIQFVKDTSDPNSGSKLEIQNDNGYNAKIRFNGYGFMA